MKIIEKFGKFDYRQVHVGGEIGHRIDNTIRNNILKLDIEKDFLAPFRGGNYTGMNDGSGPFVGLGNLINSTVRLAAYSGDEKLLKLKKFLVEETIKVQELDGYIGMLPPESRIWSLWDIHEHGYLISGLVADYTLFGEKVSLDAAQKLADYLIARWSAKPLDWTALILCTVDLLRTGFDGSFIELYNASHDNRYLDFVINDLKTGEWNSEIVKGRVFPIQGHVYMYCAHCLDQMELYRICNEDRILTSSLQALDFIRNKNGASIVGGVGQSECWTDDQDGRGAHAESCATAHQIFLYDSLLRLQGEPIWGDIIERTLYNAAFGAQSPDGRLIRYYTPFEGQRVYFDPDTYCCPNNYRRLIASLPQMLYYRMDDGIAVNLYTESQIDFAAPNGVSIKINQHTDYPNSGNIRFLIKSMNPSMFRMLFRIPRWCTDPKAEINGVPVTAEIQPGSFLSIEREWNNGDQITLEFPMQFRFVKGRQRQAGRAALMRGPLVYTLDPSQESNVAKTDTVDIGRIYLIPSTVGPVLKDDTSRVGGTAVSIRVDYETANRGEHTLTLKEFPDPAGRCIYFRLSDPEYAVEDELFT